jgi:hypothetical protein
MHGEDFVIDNSCYRQTVEAVRKSLPELDVVSSLTLVIESIDAVDGCGFVVAAQDKEVFWVFDLVC